MKKNSILTIVALVAAVLITGCSKPEEPNIFVYTVNEYPLFQGFIHNYGMPDGATGYNFDVTIHSSGVSYNRYLHEFQGLGTWCSSRCIHHRQQSSQMAPISLSPGKARRRQHLILPISE